MSRPANHHQYRPKSVLALASVFHEYGYYQVWKIHTPDWDAEILLPRLRVLWG